MLCVKSHFIKLLINKKSVKGLSIIYLNKINVRKEG